MKFFCKDNNPVNRINGRLQNGKRHASSSFLVCVFCGTSNGLSRSISDIFACSWNPFPPNGKGEFNFILGEVPSFISSCYSVLSWYSWETSCSFLKGKGRTVDMEKKEWGMLVKVEGEDSMVWMYCMRRNK